ncbi:MAG TPA: hypothetical protein VKT77_02285, partial [Chthonomonadaceae bacterium]|nr:hypothetical protein [Chthonomonadaceae bacterium]
MPFSAAARSPRVSMRRLAAPEQIASTWAARAAMIGLTLLCALNRSPAEAQAAGPPQPLHTYLFPSDVTSIAFRPGSSDLAVGLSSVKDGGRAQILRSWHESSQRDATFATMP